MMLVITKGKIGCRIGGKELLVGENEILYIPANTEFFRWIVEPIDFFQFVYHTDPASPICTQMSAGKLNIPQKNIAAMAENYALLSHLPENRLLFLHMIERIAIEHYIHRQSETQGSVGYSEDILYVLRYMNEHLSDKIDLDALAEQIYLSHVGLIWKFKNQLHTTPSRYLIKLRMHYAKQLLLEGALRVGEIATLCGYSNAYYFTNAFRKEVGISPSEFRRKHARTALEKKE
jgi:AraC-like DNA-binding protein